MKARAKSSEQIKVSTQKISIHAKTFKFGQMVTQLFIDSRGLCAQI